MERLQKIIAQSGYCSRRKAEDLIKNGKVKVNGKIVNELGAKASLNDEIEVEDNILVKEPKVYFIMNKPRGIITSTTDEKNRKTVVGLIDSIYRIYPVGRLDYDTTGLLLLTNDGELSNLLTHPKQEIEKVYIAKIKGILSLEASRKLKKGVVIDDYKTSPAKVKVRKQDKKSNTSIVEVIIHEGRYHQVKKMFEAVNYEVLKLKRERYAFLTLDGLNSGDYRQLTPKEVKKLYNLVQKKEQ